MDEIWKDIKGYEGLYQVSNQGRVRSLDRIVENGRGGFKTLKGRILSPSKDEDGYFCIGLMKDKHRKFYRISRLVAQVFIPNPENKVEVDHINTKRDDNRVENLRWATRLENSRNPLTIKNYSVAFKGENNPMYGKTGKNSPLSKVIFQISEEGILIRKWGGIREAVRNTGANRSSITLCCQGKLNVSKGYRWIYAENLDAFLIEKMKRAIEKRKRVVSVDTTLIPSIWI